MTAVRSARAARPALLSEFADEPRDHAVGGGRGISVIGTEQAERAVHELRDQVRTVLVRGVPQARPVRCLRCTVVSGDPRLPGAVDRRLPVAARAGMLAEINHFRPTVTGEVAARLPQPRRMDARRRSGDGRRRRAGALRAQGLSRAQQHARGRPHARGAARQPQPLRLPVHASGDRRDLRRRPARRQPAAEMEGMARRGEARNPRRGRARRRRRRAASRPATVCRFAATCACPRTARRTSCSCACATASSCRSCRLRSS